VVIDNSLTTPQLREFAVRALRLQRVDGDEQYDLYVPQASSGDADYLVK
jgi:hypothetical protein